MFAISNNELNNKPLLGNTIKCKKCREYHEVKYGDKIKEDGSKEKSKLLAYVKCPSNNSTYLVGINGKEI